MRSILRGAGRLFRFGGKAAVGLAAAVGAGLTSASGSLNTAKELPKFQDVIGLDHVKNELDEIKDMLLRREDFLAMNAKLPRGILLSGPPGVGKTYIIRELAKETGYNFIYRSGSDFDTMFKGSGMKRLKKLFASARANQPAIIFIDEFDSLGSKRTSDHTDDSTLNQLLTEMDGFKETENILVVAATNMPQVLDSALMRSGRFDKKIELDLPDRSTRRKLFDFYFDRLKRTNVDSSQLADLTVGYSPAQIKNLVNLAALIAVRDGLEEVSQAQVISAFEKIEIDASEPEKNFILQKDREKIAVHQAGHALFAQLSPLLKFYKTTLLPARNRLGFTHFSGTYDNPSKSSTDELLAKIDESLAGVAAEALVFGPEKVSSGCGADYSSAMRLAEELIGNTGFYQGNFLVFQKAANGNDAEAQASRDRLDTVHDQAALLIRQRLEGLKVFFSGKLGLLREVKTALALSQELTQEQVASIIDKYTEN